ncbi:MAG: hypothetical protein HZC55_10715 [Verrucomicrobia bacterium]|nr:hypothetical protein [Verrucomicrobiota bacterium]
MLAVLLLLGGLLAGRMTERENADGGRARWQKEAERWRRRANETLEQRVTPATGAVLAELSADAQRLLREMPPRGNPSELRFTLSRVDALAEKVRHVNWEDVIAWERDIQAVTDALRRAMGDAKNWDEERTIAVRTAEMRFGELRSGRPWCADPEPEEELQRTIALAKSMVPSKGR